MKLEIANSGTKEFPFYQIMDGNNEFCATDNIENAEKIVKLCTIPHVSVSLTDAEIITWLRKQNYQTEMGEQEYRMYFDVDMPKIIRAAIAHFSSGNER